MRIAVVGGGIAGLSAAYFLAKKGAEVRVFEQKYLLYGASGRNSGGITAQMMDEELIELALRSIELYDRLQSEIGFNFLLRKDGYIKIAGKKDAGRLEEEVEFQRKSGLKVDLLSPDEVVRIVPDVNTDAFEIAAFYRDGGVVFPWPVVWGLAEGCRKLEVEISDYTPVKVVADGGRVVGVKHSGGLWKADYVVNAAGAWSVEISKSVGVELKNKIVKEEICVTESIKPYLNPYILDVTSGLFLSQSMRGEIVGGISGTESGTSNFSSSLQFLTRFAKLSTNLIPKLRGLSVLRQWAGKYDVGENGKPVIGPTKLEGFMQLNGFGRHGMSVGLAAGEKLSEIVFKG